MGKAKVAKIVPVTASKVKVAKVVPLVAEQYIAHQHQPFIPQQAQQSQPQQNTSQIAAKQKPKKKYTANTNRLKPKYTANKYKEKIKNKKYSTKKQKLNTKDREYVYDRTHSRGAAALTGYDGAASGLRYNYRKTAAYLPRYEQWFRKSLYIFQMVMVWGAAIISIGAVIAERNGWDFSPLIFGQMEPELIYTPMICGGMSAFTAFIGCIGAKSRDKCGRCMLIVYAIFVFLSMSLSIASMAQAFADKGNVFLYAQRQWE